MSYSELWIESYKNELAKDEGSGDKQCITEQSIVDCDKWFHKTNNGEKAIIYSQTREMS